MRWSASSPSQAVERGIWRSALATSSGCSWRSIRCRTASRATCLQPSAASAGCATSTNASTPPDSSPSAIASQALSSTLPVLAAPLYAGVTCDQRGRALGVAQREGHGRRGAHRASHERHAVEPKVSEHGLEVLEQIRVAVAAGGGGGAVSARVVGDQAVAAPQQGAGALHDVAPRG